MIHQFVSLVMWRGNQILYRHLDEQIVVDDQLLLAIPRTLSQPLLSSDRQLNLFYGLHFLCC